MQTTHEGEGRKVNALEILTNVPTINMNTSSDKYGNKMSAEEAYI